MENLKKHRVEVSLSHNPPIIPPSVHTHMHSHPGSGVSSAFLWSPSVHIQIQILTPYLIINSKDNIDFYTVLFFSCDIILWRDF